MHETLLFCLASSWLPLEPVMAHYRVCEALALDERELTRLGESASTRIRGTLLGTILRSGRSVGATPAPWIPLRSAAGVFTKTCFANELRSSDPEAIRVLLRWV